MNKTTNSPQIPPWDDPGIRPNGKVHFNLILTEPQKAKLNFIAKHHGDYKGAVQHWLRSIIIPALDQEAEQLWNFINNKPNDPEELSPEAIEYYENLPDINQTKSSEKSS